MNLGQSLLVLCWIWGWILAKGFWLTTLAVIIPLYGYYLVVVELLGKFW